MLKAKFHYAILLANMEYGGSRTI